MSTWKKSKLDVAIIVLYFVSEEQTLSQDIFQGEGSLMAPRELPALPLSLLFSLPKKYLNLVKGRVQPRIALPGCWSGTFQNSNIKCTWIFSPIYQIISLYVGVPKLNYVAFVWFKVFIQMPHLNSQVQNIFATTFPMDKT